MVCKFCGTELREEARFCDQCGKEVERGPKPCPRCGTILPPEDNFCVVCGYIAGVPQSVKPQPQPPIQKAPRRKLSIVLLCGFLALFVILGLFFGLRSTPEKTLRAYMQAVEDRDAEGLVATYSEPYLQMRLRIIDMTRQEYVLELQEAMDGLQGSITVTVGKITEVADEKVLETIRELYASSNLTVKAVRQVEATLQTSQSIKTNSTTLYLVQLGSRWYIHE